MAKKKRQGLSPSLWYNFVATTEWTSLPQFLLQLKVIDHPGYVDFHDKSIDIMHGYMTLRRARQARENLNTFSMRPPKIIKPKGSVR